MHELSCKYLKGIYARRARQAWYLFERGGNGARKEERGIRTETVSFREQEREGGRDGGTEGGTEGGRKEWKEGGR